MRGHGPWRIAWWLSEVRMPQLVHFLTRKSHFFPPSPHEIAFSILDTNSDACFLGRAGTLEKFPYLACMKPQAQSLVLKGKQNKPHSQIQNPEDFSAPKSPPPVCCSCPTLTRLRSWPWTAGWVGWPASVLLLFNRGCVVPLLAVRPSIF